MASTDSIYGLMDYLKQTGVIEYFVPFLFIFAMLYGILISTSVIKNKNINAILSIAIALLAVQITTFRLTLFGFFANIGIMLIVVLSLLILLGIFGVQSHKIKGNVFGILAILIAVGVGWSYFAAGRNLSILGYALDRSVIYLAIFVIVFFGIIIFIMGEEDETKKKSFFDSIADDLGRPGK